MREQRGDARLIVHTGARGGETREGAADKRRKWALPRMPWPRGTKSRLRGRHGKKERAGFAERLMRNTAIACALLLTVLAVRNVGLPWTDAATDGVRAAMTMRVDLDETLGRLNFVRALVPETALVFWNLELDPLSVPVDGELSHAYSEAQPWLEYRCAPESAVCAASGGTVSAVGQGATGEWVVCVDLDDGAQTVYAYMAGATVAAGQRVESGEAIGVTAAEEASRLYFEYREGGQPVDPGPLKAHA